MIPSSTMDPWFHHSSHYPMATMKGIPFGWMSRDRIKLWSWLYNQTLHCEHFVRKYWKIGYSNISRFLLCVHVFECTLVHCTLRRFFSTIWWKWHTEVFPLIFCRSEEVSKLWMCLSSKRCSIITSHRLISIFSIDIFRLKTRQDYLNQSKAEQKMPYCGTIGNLWLVLTLSLEMISLKYRIYYYHIVSYFAVSVMYYNVPLRYCTLLVWCSTEWIHH